MTRLLTYADYAQIPVDGRRHEVVSGRHVVNPAPGNDHQHLVKRLALALVSAIEDVGSGYVQLSPADVELSAHDIVQPDLFCLTRDHVGRMQRDRTIGAPDLVVEVLSSSTRTHDLRTKRELYARGGVPEYWIVDSTARTVEQLRLTGGDFEFVARSSTSLEPFTFPGISIDLRNIWPDEDLFRTSE